MNRSPHTGHSIRSKSIRRTSAGGIKPPHFGHTASSDARTFSRLIFRERAMARPFQFGIATMQSYNVAHPHARSACVQPQAGELGSPSGDGPGVTKPLRSPTC